MNTRLGASCVIAALMASTACSSEPGGESPASGAGSGGVAGTNATTGGAAVAGGGVTTSGGNASAGATTGGASTAGSTSGNGGSSAGASTGGAGGGGSSNGGTTSGGTGGSSGSGGSGGVNEALAKFSFFVTSYPSMKKLSGKAEGFGGDLRFGKADGLAGADEICRQVAEIGMAGAGQKKWRAFLSVTKGPEGTAVNARDRIGAGPWYDALGRLVSNDLAGLFAGARPAGDAAITSDLSNEFGQSNHHTGPNGLQTDEVDNHDTLTGSDTTGKLKSTNAADTCDDWTSTTATGRPYIGHSWPRSANNGTQWASDHQVPGCSAGIDKTLGGSGSGNCIGCSGGYGGFYCFAVP